MVNAEALDLRLNRLGLLRCLHNAMNRVADLSRLASLNREPLRLVILDRDGTINEESAAFVDSPDAWRPLARRAGRHRAAEPRRLACRGGIQPVRAGRGLYEISALNAIQAKMHKLLRAVGGRIDAIFYCPHGRDEGCHCRKPEPGLFEQIGERFGIELHGMPTVGDRLEDLLAGAARRLRAAPGADRAGRAYRAGHCPDEFPAGTRVHDDLAAFAAYLIEKSAVPKARGCCRDEVSVVAWLRSCIHMALDAGDGDPLGHHHAAGLACARHTALLDGGALVALGHRWRAGHPGHPGAGGGMENLPDGARSPAILLVKHQSTFETFLLPTLMPHPLAYVFKKELLYVPFFGWAMGRLDMIHIDRSQRCEGLPPGGRAGQGPAGTGHLDHHVSGRHAHSARPEGQLQVGWDTVGDRDRCAR
jgi:D-glycero-D-manno-heptose 1,7-bisphosphate phosphatase